MNTIANIGGVSYSSANVNVLISGVPLIFVRSISYDKKRNVTNNYAIGPEPVSIGYGQVTYSGGSIEIAMDDWKRIIAGAPGGDPTLIAPFVIQIIWTPDATTPKTTTDTLLNCRFVQDGQDVKQGDTIHYKTYSFEFAGMTRI
jgi:hypothetical protein